MTTPKVDVWNYWRLSLKKQWVGSIPEQPQCGFYRRRYAKDQPWLPAAIWQDVNGIFVCRIGHKSVDVDREWPYMADKPMVQAAVKFAFDNKNEWPGDVVLPQELDLIGDNSGKVSLAEQVHEYAAQALAWFKTIGEKITNEVQATTLGNYARELQKLSKRADDTRLEENRPLRDQIKVNDAKWNPVTAEADKAYGRLQTEATRWGNEQIRLRREAEENERRAAEAAHKAALEAAQKVAEEARKAQGDTDDSGLAGLFDEETAVMSVPPPAPVAKAAPVRMGGQAGRALGMRSEKTAKITDFEKTLLYFKDNEKVRELIQKLANAAARADITVPGCAIDKNFKAA